MTIALDFKEGRIDIDETVDRLERAGQNDYTTFRGEIREIQKDIVNGLAAMRRTVQANEKIAAGEAANIEAIVGRRLDGIEAALRELVRQNGMNGSGGHG